MILGIKVGPDKQSFLDLALTRAPFAEVWFNVNRADDYNELFAELKRLSQATGRIYGNSSMALQKNLPQ